MNTVTENMRCNRAWYERIQKEESHATKKRGRTKKRDGLFDR